MNSEQVEVSPKELEREAMSAKQPSPGDDDGTGAELCPCCLQEVASLDFLCPHCGAPVSGLAGFMPWERFLAQGYIYRQAVAKPRRPVVLVGMWLVFSPPLITSAFLLGQVARGTHFDDVDLGLRAFSLCVSVAALYQTTRNYFHPQAPVAVATD